MEDDIFAPKSHKEAEQEILKVYHKFFEKRRIRHEDCKGIVDGDCCNIRRMVGVALSVMGEHRRKQH